MFEGAAADIAIITLSAPNFYGSSLSLTRLPFNLLFMKSMKTLSEDMKFNLSLCRRGRSQVRTYVLLGPLTLDRYSKHASRAEMRHERWQIASDRCAQELNNFL